MSLPLVIDLIISRLFNIEGFFINTTRIGCLGISLFIFEMIVLYPDNVQNHSESINQKFTWSVEDILILLFVFGPMFLLPLLM
jgi:membrane-bound ClpP family serine protease